MQLLYITRAVILIVVFFCSISHSIGLQEFIQWNQIDYENLPENGNFVRSNNVPQGFTPYKDKIFIAVPRRNVGIPSTLNYIKLNGSDSYINPKLIAYPSYEMNELDPSGEANPNKIVSVYRPRVDECERLWFVDSGVINTSGNSTTIQRPSIWVIDLKTDSILKRYEIPENVLRGGVGIASITVDVIDCDVKSFAYIPDLVDSKMIIYNLEENKAYAMSHNYFRMNPFEGDFNVDGLRFSWDDGIFSIALSPTENGHRIAYFHPMSSFSEFSISTKILRNETLATRSYHGDDVQFVGNRGKGSMSTMHSIHQDTDVAFFAQVNQNAVWCWNTRRALRPAAVREVFRDDVKMIYPADLSVVKNDLWVLSNRMIRQIYSSIDPNDVNFRIFRQSVRDVTCLGRRSQRRRFRN